MEIVIEEVPSIVLLVYNVLPKRIEEVAAIYDKMMKQGYPLDYLNVEYNISEATTKIKNIIVRTKSLNLQDSLFELKVLLDYFDSLFVDFENEKRSKKAFVDKVENLYSRLEKINSVINELFSSMDNLQNIYNLSDDNIKEEVEGLSSELLSCEENLDNSLNEIGNMRDDEVRARHQLEEIKMVLKESKNKMREYNLPEIPNNYYVELKEASLAMNEISKELSRKPIVIDILNTRVDTARDLVLKLYTKTTDIVKFARLSEALIVYSNRYRSTYNDLNKILNISEQLFYKGDYQRSLSNTLNAIRAIDTDVYNKINDLINKA